MGHPGYGPAASDGPRAHRGGSRAPTLRGRCCFGVVEAARVRRRLRNPELGAKSCIAGGRAGAAGSASVASVGTRGASVGLRWVAPAVGTAAAVAGLAYVGAVNPTRGGVFIPCPIHRLTGRWCPGCGMTRALHDLLHGDVRAALGANLFLPVVLTLGLALWLGSLWPALTGRRLDVLSRVPTAVWSGLIVLALVYGVLRNLPAAPFNALAP